MKSLPSHTIGSVDSIDVMLAGQRVSAGVYLDVESGRIVVLEAEGFLPAACDGRVAVYTLRPQTWGEIRRVGRDAAA